MPVPTTTPLEDKEDKSSAFSSLNNIQSTRQLFLTSISYKSRTEIPKGTQTESSDSRTEKPISIFSTSKTSTVTRKYFLHFTTSGYENLKKVHGETIELYKLLKSVRKNTKKQ